ncbi:MAG: septal ring lytic transglycosylase RlpA family protein [Saprospiraceae bacterium]|nr:septal ring lytic transglycosylase RlpA family protein [Saprospiraceae bacterium]
MRHTILLLTSIFTLTTTLAMGAFAQDSREEFGKCGYYADALHGRKTSSGEIYDKSGLTCAHKTLPFGTMIRVTRMDNKKSVVVKVNDRGPYLDGYVTDVSRKAAEALGLVRDGVTRVKLEIVENKTSNTGLRPAEYSSTSKVLPKSLEPVAPVTASTGGGVGSTAQLAKSSKGQVSVAPIAHSAPASTAPEALATAETKQPVAAASTGELYQVQVKPVGRKGYGLQLTSLSNAENILPETAKVQALWPGKVVINHEEQIATGAHLYKVILGPYATRKEAEAQQRRAASKGYKKAFVVDLAE